MLIFIEFFTKPSVSGNPFFQPLYKGTRRMKLLDSNEIRQLRDACVFEINGMEVFM